MTDTPDEDSLKEALQGIDHVVDPLSSAHPTTHMTT